MQLIATLHPDVVLMDINLNGCPEGINATGEIRDRFDLPVIYLTAHSDTSTLEKAKITEPYGYILKPFEDRELMAAIETAVQKHAAEKRLRQAERWLAATLSSIGDAVITLDHSLRITFINRVAVELTGWEAQPAIGEDLFRIVRLSNPEAESGARRLIMQAVSGRAPCAGNEPFDLIANGGRHAAVLSSVAPILTEQGEIDGVVLAFRDVTETHRAQCEVRERGEQQATANRLAQRALSGLDFLAFMEETCDAVRRQLSVDVCEWLALGEGGNELRMQATVGGSSEAGGVLPVGDSPQARRLLDRSEPAVFHEFKGEPSEKDPLLGRHGALSMAGVTIGVSSRPCGILAAYSRDERSFTDNQIEFLQSVAYTLRAALERNALEKRLRETEQMESIGVLAGGIAHDFNNLLAVIMGHADEARAQCKDCAPMCAILAASDRAANLTRQLLAYAGKGHVVSKRFDLSELVAQSADTLRRSLHDSVTLDLALGTDLPVLEADPKQVRQILANLICNAGEAIASGAQGVVRVETGTYELTAEMAPAHSAVYSAAPGKYVYLKVSDNGCGIAEGVRERIFDPFFSTKFIGRGLGLAGVQGIVRVYGGFVLVDSVPGSGATFSIFLPACTASAVVKPAVQASALGSPRAVLVIEDEPLVRKMVVRMVERLGFQVLQAENGVQALDVISQAAVTPALALVDLMMPIMGAAELLPILDTRYPSLKVIATSGYPEPEARRVLRSERVAGFLQKPYKRDVLSEVITKALN